MSPAGWMNWAEQDKEVVKWFHVCPKPHQNSHVFCRSKPHVLQNVRLGEDLRVKQWWANGSDNLLKYGASSCPDCLQNVRDTGCNNYYCCYYYTRLTASFSRTTWVSQYQIDKASLDLNEARDDGVLGWQWHQLDHMQTICTSLQTDNNTYTSSLNFYRLHGLLGAQPTVSKH